MTELQANGVMDHLMRHSDQFASWTFEYPGYVWLNLDGGGCWCIGTDECVYGADLYIDDGADGAPGDPDHSIQTDIPDTSTDYRAIAAALYAAMVAIP